MQLTKYKKRESNRVSERTLKSRLSALNRLEDFVGGGEITVEDVEEWIDHLIDEFEKGNIKSSTIRQYLKSVDYYFEAVKGEYDSIEHIKRRLPDPDVDHGEYLDEEEWEILRSSVDNIRNRLVIELMYWYARRPGEIILLNEEDIDVEEKTIVFNILKKSKDDRGRPLPYIELTRDGEVYDRFQVMRATFELVDEVEYLMNMHLTHSPKKKQTVIYDGEEMEVTPLFCGNNARISYSAVWSMIKNEVKKAGIDKNITPKSARHSRSTHLNWQGHTPDEIADQQLLHDPESNVVSGYVHEREEEDVRGVMGTGGDDERN